MIHIVQCTLLLYEPHHCTDSSGDDESSSTGSMPDLVTATDSDSDSDFDGNTDTDSDSVPDLLLSTDRDFDGNTTTNYYVLPRYAHYSYCMNHISVIVLQMQAVMLSMNHISLIVLQIQAVMLSNRWRRLKRDREASCRKRRLKSE
jgi:hypothetical protein